MSLLSYSIYRFPRDIVLRAVWMYPCYILSNRDVEELVVELEIKVTSKSTR